MAGAGGRRDRVLRVRATSEEIDGWKATARASGMPLSELVRRSIGRARAWSPDRAAIERDRTLQLARIGNNLNQLARWANAHKRAADAVRVTAALAALQRDLDALSPGRRKGKPADADQVHP